MTNALKPQHTAELRADLTRRAAGLREEIRQTLLKSDSEQYLQIADNVRDLEDESFADLMVDINLAEIDRDLTELRATEQALQKIASGTYGNCEDCGLPIEHERLKLTPFASRCVDCQSVHERLHLRSVGQSL